MQANCISALDMRFKDSNELRVTSCLLLVVILVTCYLLLATAVYAEVLERVVAIIDDEIILLSEFKETFQKMSDSGKEITEEEVLNGMINRILLLKEAKKFRTETILGEDKENVLINEYIEKRLKAFIRIPPEDIELFYEKNKKSFDKKDFYDASDEIEIYLTEKELNKRLLNYIQELREKAYIRIQLEK
ncbi:MAG: hypothetical protein HY752_02295 [Nitrospirae bacterium]|nr:hypothetical protein [Nitrospirota bacterium]